MRIRRIDIENFRGIKSASWRLPKDQSFVALVGPGDSTKTTLITAIERALHDRAGMLFSRHRLLRRGRRLTQFVSASLFATCRTSSSPWTPSAAFSPASTTQATGPMTRPTKPTGVSSSNCVVEADLEPVWQSYRPPLDEGDEPDEIPTPIRARHRTAHDGLPNRRPGRRAPAMVDDLVARQAHLQARRHQGHAHGRQPRRPRRSREPRSPTS